MRNNSLAFLFVSTCLLAGCALNRVKQIEQKAQSNAATAEGNRAASVYWDAAEELKELGSAKAAEYYRKAISAAPEEPYYRFAYAEYLRKYRGPGQPLLPAAANEYFKALRILDARRESEKAEGEKDAEAGDDERLRQLIDWGLTDLYQRDGVPLLYWPPAVLRPRRSSHRPTVFFSTQYEFGPSELPIRDLTSGALFTSDTIGRSLTNGELRAMVRSKQLCDWTNRIRIRPGDLPWIDIWWRRVEAGDAIPNDWNPGRFFDLHQVQHGIAAERAFDLYPFDLSVRVGYKHSRWRTVKDPQADAVESSHTPFAEVVLSRVFPGYSGPNRVSIALTHERSHIHHGGAWLRRGTISSATAGYSIYPKKGRGRFRPRSADVEAGVVRYLQEYGAVDVYQHDLFVGVTLREAFSPKLDLGARYTVFDEDKRNSAPERSHQQGRVSLTPLWRLVDNENAKEEKARNSRVRFVNIVAPLDYQFKQKGPSDYENFGYGIKAEARIAHPKLFRTSVLLFAECSRRHYYNLDKVLSYFMTGLKMGF